MAFRSLHFKRAGDKKTELAARLIWGRYRRHPEDAWNHDLRRFMSFNTHALVNRALSEAAVTARRSTPRMTFGKIWFAHYCRAGEDQRLRAAIRLAAARVEGPGIRIAIPYLVEPQLGDRGGTGLGVEIPRSSHGEFQEGAHSLPRREAG